MDKDKEEGEAEQILQPSSFIRGGGAGEGTKVDVRGRGHKGPFINDICIIFQDLGPPPLRLHFEQPVSTFSNIPPQCGHHLWMVHNRSHSGACVTLLSSSSPLPPLHNEVAPPQSLFPDSMIQFESVKLIYKPNNLRVPDHLSKKTTLYFALCPSVHITKLTYHQCTP